MGAFTESIQNEKILTEIFFSDNVERYSKYLRKNVSADVKGSGGSGGSILQDF